MKFDKYAKFFWLSTSFSAVDEYGIISDEVPVAQWIERVPPEHETAGSSPVGDVLVPNQSLSKWLNVIEHLPFGRDHSEPLSVL